MTLTLQKLHLGQNAELDLEWGALNSIELAAPDVFQTSFVNPGPGGIYARLEELGHHLDHFEEEIRARMPSPTEVKTLRLASGAPVIHLIRTAYDTEGRPEEVGDTIMAAGAYVLSYQLPAN